MPQLDAITDREYPYVNDPQPEPDEPHEPYRARVYVSEGRVLFEIARLILPSGVLTPIRTDRPIPKQAMDALVGAWLRYRIGDSKWQEVS